MIATDAARSDTGGTSEDEDLSALKLQVEKGQVEEARAFVRELESRWPESSRVRYWAHVLAPPKFLGHQPATGRPLDRERNWLRDHAKAYPGCWIAVHGDELVAADPDLKVVTEAIRRTNIVDPLVHFQPDTRK